MGLADGLAERTLNGRQALQDGRQLIIFLTDGMNVWSNAPNHNKSVYSSFGYYTGGRLTARAARTRRPRQRREPRWT